jgi:hypothetical protein
MAVKTAGGAEQTGATHAPPDAASLLKQLGVNSPLFVQRPGADAADRHSGILIGNIRNERLLIGVYDGVELDTGEGIVVRLGMGSHLVGFETQVLKKVDDPPLYVVKFPEQVHAMNLRKAQRIQAFFPADVQVREPGSDQVYLLKTRVLDISAGGCSFRSKTKLPAAHVQMSFALPGERRVHSVKGAIVESARMGLVYHSRVKFVNEAVNVPIMQDVAQWVAEGLSFGLN